MNRIISGGQTGADRAGLDWAIRRGIEHGGWCPKGRLAGDGPIDPKYRVKETISPGYFQRTKRNLLEADGTLIFMRGDRAIGGTGLTIRLALEFNKPHLVVRVDSARPDTLAALIKQWLDAGKFSCINIAGPSELTDPGIYADTTAILELC